jgi:hypothetical protein
MYVTVINAPKYQISPEELSNSENAKNPQQLATNKTGSNSETLTKSISIDSTRSNRAVESKTLDLKLPSVNLEDRPLTMHIKPWGSNPLNTSRFLSKKTLELPMPELALKPAITDPVKPHSVQVAKIQLKPRQNKPTQKYGDLPDEVFNLLYGSDGFTEKLESKDTKRKEFQIIDKLVKKTQVKQKEESNLTNQSATSFQNMQTVPNQPAQSPSATRELQNEKLEETPIITYNEERTSESETQEMGKKGLVSSNSTLISSMSSASLDKKSNLTEKKTKRIVRRENVQEKKRIEDKILQKIASTDKKYSNCTIYQDMLANVNELSGWDCISRDVVLVHHAVYSPGPVVFNKLDQSDKPYVNLASHIVTDDDYVMPRAGRTASNFKYHKQDKLCSKSVQNYGKPKSWWPWISDKLAVMLSKNVKPLKKADVKKPKKKVATTKVVPPKPLEAALKNIEIEEEDEDEGNKASLSIDLKKLRKAIESQQSAAKALDRATLVPSKATVSPWTLRGTLPSLIDVKSDVLEICNKKSISLILPSLGKVNPKIKPKAVSLNMEDNSGSSEDY